MHAFVVVLTVAGVICFVSVISTVYFMLNAPPLPCEMCGLPAVTQAADRSDQCEACFQELLQTVPTEDEAPQANVTVEIETRIVNAEAVFPSFRHRPHVTRFGNEPNRWLHP
jgi:hypothetical protein